MATYNYGYNPIGAFSDNAALPNATTAYSTALNISNISGQLAIVVHSDDAWSLADNKIFDIKVQVSNDNSTWVSPFEAYLDYKIMSKLLTEPETTTAGQCVTAVVIPKVKFKDYDYIRLAYTCDEDLSSYEITALLVGNV